MEMFVYEQKSLCVHTDILDVYHSALWTKKLYNTLLFNFVFQFELRFSASLFKKGC